MWRTLESLPREQLVSAAGAVALALLSIAGPLLLWRRRSRARRRAAAARPAEREAPAEPLPRGLAGALARTRAGLARQLSLLGLGSARRPWVDVVEEALIVADVGMNTTRSLIGKLERRLPRECSRAEAVEGLAQVLREVLNAASPDGVASTDSPRPWVILVTGVNGVGKTTTIGKLAAQHRRQGRSVLLVAADTFRAAAGDQLERWAERTSSLIVQQAPGADPAAVVVDGLRSAASKGADVVLVDTAGRLHTKVNLMEELRKIRRVMARECPGAPHETLLVLDASTGQNGLQQARLFKDAVDLTGVVMTKMDGTAKGGIAVAVVAELGVPIQFIGLGEGVDDLRPFDPGDFVAALLPGAGEFGEQEVSPMPPPEAR